MKSIIIILFLFSCHCIGQNKTDTSLFMKAEGLNYLTDLGSESGDLYESIGHHGPAIENEWMALRIYFNEKAAIDVYSKPKPGLELRKTLWYPTIKQQKDGSGADYYKVGETVGLGGVRLWDGEKVVLLNPVTNRFVRVVKTNTTSYMEMISKGVPYNEKKVDILVRVTVFSGERAAKVEAFNLADEPIQFVTGINYHKEFKSKKGENYIATWGIHPEDVAIETIEIGAAIIYNSDDFIEKIDEGTQYLLISKPTKHIEISIISASSNEKEINTFKKLVSFID